MVSSPQSNTSMPTSRYVYMQKRVTTLRRFMLPSKFSPTGLYADRVHQRTAAFRLLVHGEFESYIEEMVLDHATRRISEWKKNRIPSITLASLLAYDEIAGKSPTSVLTPPQKPALTTDDRINEAFGRFNNKIRRLNHGVRELNILSMLLPIGVEASMIDATWLSSLDTWAHERGDLAHQSSGKVQHKLDPKLEYKKVQKLLTGFKDVDLLISRIR